MDRNEGICRIFLHWSCGLFLAFFTITAVTVTPSQVSASDQQDTEPPTSSATLIGNWNGSYFTSSVEVSISAIDSPSGQSQDIAYTAYRINSGTWIHYTEPFVVHAEGHYTVSFFSEDDDGNPEQAKTTQFEINSQTPSPTPLPTSVVFVTSTPNPTATPTPTPIEGLTVTPSVTPKKSSTSTDQSSPASFPYYQSPTKTPTPTPNRNLPPIKIASSNNPTTSVILSSPTPVVKVVQESTIIKDTEPQSILGQSTSVRNDQPGSTNPLLILILALAVLSSYIFFVFYSYSKIKN